MISEQEKLRKTQIGILGVGGLGGPLIEQLTRSGCQNFVICDFDKYEESNLNRQLCTIEDIGKYKVDVVGNFLHKIDPKINIKKYYEINQNNLSKMIKNLDIVVLTLDDLITSIIISRECRKMNIPMLESWGIPCLWAWWFTSESIDYESCYRLKTHNLSSARLYSNDNPKFKSNHLFLPKIFQIPGVKKLYDREPGVFEEMMSGSISARSFTPFIRITASYLAIEVIFAGILKVKPMVLAPKIMGYDYIKMKPVDMLF
jgi:hypothetical protein